MSAIPLEIRLPTELSLRLNQLAKLKGCSLEDLIVQMLDRALDASASPLPDESPTGNETLSGAESPPAESTNLATSQQGDATAASYDRVADEYAAQFFGELAHKPLDRALLDAFAEEVRGLGPVADIGCGPGQIARYLHDRSTDAMGIDLSPRMVALAGQLSPGIPFRVGSMLALDLEDAALGGIVAFYSIIHIPPEHLPQALREFHRVLRPGGRALLAFHVGQERRHLDEWWERPVALDFQFYEPEHVARELEVAGFAVDARLVRAPYADVEHPSTRGYLLARKP